MEISANCPTEKPCLHCRIMDTINEFLAETGGMGVREVCEALNAVALTIVLNVAVLGQEGPQDGKVN